MKIAAIIAGGMIGALLRFWIGVLLFQSDKHFPFPTLLINLIGSFILGWYIVHGSELIKNRTVVLGIQTGFLGSFTTFSTFNVEILLLLDQGLYSISAVYFLSSALMGIGAVLLGMKCGTVLLEKEGAER